MLKSFMRPYLRIWTSSFILSSSIVFPCFVSTVLAVPVGFRELQTDLLDPASASAWAVGNEQASQLRTALEILKKGDVVGSLRLSEEYLRSNPTSAPAHELSGVCLALQGNTEEGLRRFHQAIKLDPKQSTAYTKIGDVHLTRGQNDLAKEFFLKALAIDPADRIAHQRIGLILEEEGDIIGAISHLESGIRGTPSSYLGVKVNLARLYNLEREYSKATKLLEPLVTEDCKVAQAHLVLGTSYLGVRQPARALEAFRRAEKLSPDSNNYQLALGAAYRESGDPSASLKILQKLVEELGPLAHFQLGETYASMTNIDKALFHFNMAAKGATNNSHIRARTAELYANHGKYGEALALYDQLLAESHAPLRVYDGKATVLQLLGRLDEAERVLLAASEKFPSLPDSHYRLGLHYGFSRQYDKALAEFEKAHSLAPGDPRVLKASSLTALRKGDIDQAILVAGDLLKRNPESVTDRFYLATLHETKGDRMSAEGIYDAILAKDPNHTASLNNLANLHLQNGKSDLAVDLANRAIALAPENPAVLDTLGWALYHKSNYSGAAKHLKKAVSKSPENSTYNYHLGATFFRLGQIEDARRHIEKSIALKDEFRERPDAEKLLSSIPRR